MHLGSIFLLALLEGLVSASVLALTACGLSLVFGIMRVVNVAHGEFFMLGAVLAWFTASLMPGPPALAFAVALVICPLIVGAIAALADMLVLKRLNYEPEATIVATIGLLYILQQGALTVFGPNALPVPPPLDFRLQFPAFGYSGYKIAVIVAAVLLLLGLWLILTRTRIGLVMRATQIDRATARAFGINVDRVYAGVFAMGAGLAAIAAVLIVPIQQAHYLMGADPLLLSFSVVIIGGLGSLRGTVVAALLIGMVDQMVPIFMPVLFPAYGAWFTPTLAKIMATLVVALVLVFRPQGLFGKRAA